MVAMVIELKVARAIWSISASTRAERAVHRALVLVAGPAG